jgi:raffinose/stachyose/melibiose transport system permease protein
VSEALLRRRAIRGVTILFLLLVSVIVITPLLYMVLGSFKTPLEASSFSLSLPGHWLFRNYPDVVREGSLGRAFVNSCLIAAVSSALTVFFSSIASFVVARKRSRLAQFLYYFFFLGSLAPMQIIPTIQILKVAHIYGSFASVILIYAALNLSFGCFLYTGFIKSVPRALDEAALMEGASLFGIFFRVIFPLLTPANVTVSILIFLSIWNDINLPIYFLPDPTKWTMPLSVYGFFGRYSSSWNLVFADLTLTALPVVILYLAAQKYVVSGLLVGAVKQ